MPPIEQPIRQASFSMPRFATIAYVAFATSSSERSGKLRRYGSPVAGSIDAGQVEPLSLPSEFTQITNQRVESMALPGPSMSSHQPGAVSAELEAACALGDRPVKISTALSRAAFNVPQVS